MGTTLSNPYQVPTDADPPWDAPFRTLELFHQIETHQPISVVIPDLGIQLTQMVERSPAEILLQLQEATIWNYVLHWLYKLEFNSKHKMPSCEATPGTKAIDIKKGTKITGELLWSALELCKACHFFRSSHSQQYNHAADWFTGVANDIRNLCFGIERGSNKLQKVQSLRAYSKLLKDNQNPFDKTIFPHLHRLIEVARKLSTHPDYPSFRSKFLTKSSNKTGAKGFIYALSAWTTELQTNQAFKITQANQHGLSYASGKGHGKITATSKQVKSRVAKILSG